MPSLSNQSKITVAFVIFSRIIFALALVELATHGTVLLRTPAAAEPTVCRLFRKQALFRLLLYHHMEFSSRLLDEILAALRMCLPACRQDNLHAILARRNKRRRD